MKRPLLILLIITALAILFLSFQPAPVQPLTPTNTPPAVPTEPNTPPPVPPEVTLTPGAYLPIVEK